VTLLQLWWRRVLGNRRNVFVFIVRCTFHIDFGSCSPLSNRYRDPNCSKTAEVFQACAEWAADARFTDEDVSQVRHTHGVCCAFSNPLRRQSFPSSPQSTRRCPRHRAGSACSPTVCQTSPGSCFATVCEQHMRPPPPPCTQHPVTCVCARRSPRCGAPRRGRRVRAAAQWRHRVRRRARRTVRAAVRACARACVRACVRCFAMNENDCGRRASEVAALGWSAMPATSFALQQQ
jgi:hypothetical protein